MEDQEVILPNNDSISQVSQNVILNDQSTIVGAASIAEYLPLLIGKRVAIVGNQTSVIGATFLVDTLISLGIDVRILLLLNMGLEEIMMQEQR